jgi:hypothetical protein
MTPENFSINALAFAASSNRRLENLSWSMTPAYAEQIN